MYRVRENSNLSNINSKLSNFLFMDLEESDSHGETSTSADTSVSTIEPASPSAGGTTYPAGEHSPQQGEVAQHEDDEQLPQPRLSPLPPHCFQPPPPLPVPQHPPPLPGLPGMGNPDSIHPALHHSMFGGPPLPYPYHPYNFPQAPCGLQGQDPSLHASMSQPGYHPPPPCPPPQCTDPTMLMLSSTLSASNPLCALQHLQYDEREKMGVRMFEASSCEHLGNEVEGGMPNGEGDDQRENDENFSMELSLPLNFLLFCSTLHQAESCKLPCEFKYQDETFELQLQRKDEHVVCQVSGARHSILHELQNRCDFHMNSVTLPDSCNLPPSFEEVNVAHNKRSDNIEKDSLEMNQDKVCEESVSEVQNQQNDKCTDKTSKTVIRKKNTETDKAEVKISVEPICKIMTPLIQRKRKPASALSLPSNTKVLRVTAMTRTVPRVSTKKTLVKIGKGQTHKLMTSVRPQMKKIVPKLPKSVTDENQATCMVCSKVLPSEKSLLHHLDSIHKLKPGDQKTKNAVTISDEDEELDDVCDDSSSSEGEADEEDEEVGGNVVPPVVKKHGRKPQFPGQPRVKTKGIPGHIICDFCDKKYVKPGQCARHEGNCRLNPTNPNYGTELLCENCGKGYRNRWGLRKHRYKVHGVPMKVTLYPCEKCNKQFDTRLGLSRHSLKHTGEKKFMCDICGKQFKHNFDLKKHNTTVHLNQWKFFCQKCGHGVEKKKYLDAHKCDRVRLKDRKVSIYFLQQQEITGLPMPSPVMNGLPTLPHVAEDGKDLKHEQVGEGAAHAIQYAIHAASPSVTSSDLAAQAMDASGVGTSAANLEHVPVPNPLFPMFLIAPLGDSYSGQSVPPQPHSLAAQSLPSHTLSSQSLNLPPLSSHSLSSLPVHTQTLLTQCIPTHSVMSHSLPHQPIMPVSATSTVNNEANPVQSLANTEVPKVKRENKAKPLVQMAQSHTHHHQQLLPKGDHSKHDEHSHPTPPPGTYHQPPHLPLPQHSLPPLPQGLPPPHIAFSTQEGSMHRAHLNQGSRDTMPCMDMLHEYRLQHPAPPPPLPAPHSYPGHPPPPNFPLHHHHSHPPPRPPPMADDSAPSAPPPNLADDSPPPSLPPTISDNQTPPATSSLSENDPPPVPSSLLDGPPPLPPMPDHPPHSHSHPPMPTTTQPPHSHCVPSHSYPYMQPPPPGMPHVSSPGPMPYGLFPPPPQGLPWFPQQQLQPQ